MIAGWPRWFRVCQFDLICFNNAPYIRCQQWNIWWPLIISLQMKFAPWWFFAQGSLRLYNFNKPHGSIIFFYLFFSFQSFRTDVEYEVVILPSALLQNWSVWYKIVLHKKGDITKAVTKRQKQLLLPSLWLSKISIWAGLINCLLRQHDTNCTVPTPQKQKYLAPKKTQKSNQIV